jgi:S1-C subfamily serine protease
MERSQLPELQKQLPRATIDFRRGGLLGIKADNSGGNATAVVGFVQKGSAAEAAGIKVGDAIAKIENQPVTNFQDLTSKIGEHLPGDEVMLEIQRGGMPLTLKAKLGQWTADNLPGRMTPP